MGSFLLPLQERNKACVFLTLVIRALGAPPVPVLAPKRGINHGFLSSPALWHIPAQVKYLLGSKIIIVGLYLLSLVPCAHPLHLLEPDLLVQQTAVALMSAK